MALSVKNRDKLMAGPYTQLLAKHETACADLYAVFAGLLENSAPFWRSLVAEEMDHRRLIEEVDEKLHDGEWPFKRPAFITSGIMESIEWIDAWSKDAERNGISMREALKL